MSKELEQLRQIKHDFYVNGKVDYDSISYFTNIEKSLKALDIIRNHCCIIQKGILPREKQDLLNEVLVCH